MASPGLQAPIPRDIRWSSHVGRFQKHRDLGWNLQQVIPQDRAIALGVKPLSLDGDDEGVAYDQSAGGIRWPHLTTGYDPCWILLASK